MELDSLIKDETISDEAKSEAENKGKYDN